ncbi:MAG: FtsX-like permease family protein, partial [Gemmatimonadaceae bacterium]
NSSTHVTIDGYTPLPDEGMTVDYSVVSPGYFEALRVPMTKGRTFTARDDSLAAPVAIVNERFVERFLKGRDPIGAPISSLGDGRTIVGVTSTGKYRSLGESPLEYVYTPQAQTWRAGMSVVIRTAHDPSAFIPSLRTEVTALDPTLPLSDVKTMESHLGIALLPSRIAGTALGVFGLLGLVLAAVGMYGVMAYSVAQRTREIGIRMAIGSTQGEVVRLVIRQGMKLVAIGSAVGLVGALGAARLARGLLYGGSASDPVTIGVVTLVLVSVALLAVWIPARRASRVDPILALRSE